MPNIIISALIALAVSFGGFLGVQELKQSNFGAFGDPFLSIQVGTTPAANDILQTDGTDSTWVTCATLTGSADLCDGSDATGGGGSGGDDPFSHETNYGVLSSATSTPLWAKVGLFASSTSHFVNLDFNYATGSQATTSNFAITSLSSELLKVDANGSVIEALADSDYQVPLTFGDGLTRSANDIDCDTASDSVFGCLTSAFFSKFNSATTTFTSPLTYTGATNAVTLDTSGTWSGNAGTASALAANGSNCSLGSASGGVSASGVAEDCTDYWTEAENTSAGYTSNTGTVTSIATTWPLIGGTITTTGTLTFGGLSTSTAAVISNIPYFSGVNTFANVATSSLTINSPLTTSGTAGALVGGTAFTIDIDDIKAADLDLTDITLNDFTNDANFLTGNQTITLSGDVSGSGATAITTTLGLEKVFGKHLATSTSIANGELITYVSATDDFGGLTCAEITGSADLCDGSDAVGAGGGGGDDPFTHSTYNGQTVSATSTGIRFTGSPLSIIASSTLADFATTTSATTTDFYISGDLQVANLTSALTLTGAGGVFAEYAGATCTNQAITALSALGASTCTSITNSFFADGDWGELTVTGGSFTIDAESIAIAELSDVTITSAAYGDVLMYGGSAWVDSATSTLFSNASASITGLLSSTDWATFNAKDSVTTAGDGLTRTVNDFDCDTASASVFGCLSAADWLTFNAKSSFGQAFEITTNIFSQASLKATSTATHNLVIDGTGTSTFSGGLEVWRQIAAPYFHATSTTATSTFPQLTSTGIRALTSLQFDGEILPDGITCSAGQILKKTGDNDWDCAADATATGAADDFAFATNYGVISAATSSPIWAQSGVFASSTSHFVDLDFRFATGTRATTTAFAITSLSSELLKVDGNGSVLEAIADSDYQVPLTFGDGLTRTSNDIDCDTANSTTFGCLSSANWTTFNNKWDLASATIAVPYGGTGATTLTDGGVLLGSGTGAITPMGVLADGSIIVGDGTTDPVALAAFESSTGDLSVTAGGSGVGTLTGMLKGNGTSDFTGITGVTSLVARWTDANTIGTGILFDNNTNVGVSTSTPWAKLSIGTVNQAINSPAFAIGSSSTGVATTSTFEVYSNGKAGLGIGTSTTGQWATLAVNPVAGAFNNRFAVGSSSATSFLIDNSGHIFMPQLTTDAAAHTYTMCGAATTFEAIWDTTTCVLSAAKYKTNIEDLDIGLTELLKVRPVSFNWKPTGDPTYDNDINTKHNQIGVIANEIESLDSRLVTYDNTGEIKGFRYDFFTAWITKAVQEMWGEVVNLIDWNKDQERRIKALEDENELLKVRLEKLENKR